MRRPDPDPARSHEPVEDYAGGEIQVRRGIVNRWLLVVYLILFVWGIYYLFADWGGLGPGLAR
jgi:hypothetical protein